MSTQAVRHGNDAGREAAKSRPVRADARRNIHPLLQTAAAVFAPGGVLAR